MTEVPELLRGAHPAPPLNPPSRCGGPVPVTEVEFVLFRDLLRVHTGIVLNDMKRQLVCTRLSQRVRQLGYDNFTRYHLHLMTEDPRGEELRRMLNAMTTNKTSFFREEHHFAFLRDELLPGLVERATTEGGPVSLRIWSAACSSGEEPYSVAMTVADVGPLPHIRDTRILASDIDTDMLAMAERGVYDEDRIERLDPSILRRHFLRGRGPMAGNYQVRQPLREMCAFRRINFQEASWPIHTLFDCIFCRNVVIYFDRETQERLVRRLLTYLRPGGYLFLGHSESILGMKVGLTYLGKTIYQRPTSGEVGEELP